MRRRKSLGELKRALKRRLETETQTNIELAAREMRAYAIASAFSIGYSVEQIEKHNSLAQKFDSALIESCIRNQMRLR